MSNRSGGLEGGVFGRSQRQQAAESGPGLDPFGVSRVCADSVSSRRAGDAPAAAAMQATQAKREQRRDAWAPYGVRVRPTPIGGLAAGLTAGLAAGRDGIMDGMFGFVSAPPAPLHWRNHLPPSGPP